MSDRVWVYWNDEQPTAPGWYWLFNPDPGAKGINPEIVLVGKTPDGPAMRVIGEESAYGIEPGLVCYWSGPIEVPEKEITVWQRQRS